MEEREGIDASRDSKRTGWALPTAMCNKVFLYNAEFARDNYCLCRHQRRISDRLVWSGRSFYRRVVIFTA
jgi:hypothetical protein